MATQGLISIVKEGKVIFKCVAGCNGFNAPKTAVDIRNKGVYTIESIYQTCIENDFGCGEDLVVQSENDFKFQGEEDLQGLYVDKFNDPKFNPRWARGTAEFTEIIEL